MGIADRTPKRRASYDAVDTTPRPPSPPTITGLPRNDGLSRCSTAAKKASRSRWRIDASGRTAAPHPGGHRHRQHGAHPIRPPLDRLRDRRVEPTSDPAGEAALRQARGPDGRPRLSPSDRVSPCRVAMETEELVAFMRTRGMAVVATPNAEGCQAAALVGWPPPSSGSSCSTPNAPRARTRTCRGVHRVAVVVGWDERQTVPVEGVAHQPTGEDRERCASAHPTQRPGGAARTEDPSRALIRITPGWVRATDFRPGSAGVREAAWA